MKPSNEWTQDELKMFLFGFSYRSAMEIYPKASAEELNIYANEIMIGGIKMFVKSKEGSK